MKNFYGVIISEKGGKYCAASVRVLANTDIKPFICEGHIKACHLCNSRKEAIETAAAWNAQYKADGIYYFDYLKEA